MQCPGRVVVAAALLAVVAGTTGCGTRLSHDRVIAEARVGGTSIGAAGAEQATASDEAASTEIADSDTVVPGEVRSSAGGASSATSNKGRAGGTASVGQGTVSAAGSKSQILLGNVGDYAGVPGSVLGSAQSMLQVWAKSVNGRGGLNGHPVKVISADAGSDPARSLALVRRMVEEDHVVAFLNNNVPISLSGHLRYLEEHRIPSVGGDLVSAFWNRSPMLFPQGTGINLLVDAMPKIAVAAATPKLGIIWCVEASFVCGNAHDQLTTRGGIKRAGGTLVFEAGASLAQPDFTSECLQARQRGVQNMILIMDPASTNRITRSCNLQEFEPRYTTASLAVSPTLEGNSSINGLTAPVSTFPWMLTSTPATAEYAQAIKSYAPGLVSSTNTSQTWVSGKILERIAGSFDATVTTPEILRGLWTLKDETLGGLTVPLTFKENQPTASSTCYFVVRMSNASKWGAPENLTPRC